jgi:hypothetical protein
MGEAEPLLGRSRTRALINPDPVEIWTPPETTFATLL